MRAAWLALALVLLGVPASVAAAQEAEACAEGRERVDGFCCWPGQTFAADARRCEGAPQCPDGLVEHGEACIAPALGAAPPPIAPMALSGYEGLAAGVVAPVAPAAPVITLDGWPATHSGGVVHRPVARHGEDGGLVAAAMVVFDIGWTFGMLVGLNDAATAQCSVGTFFTTSANANCNSWPLALIPVGGGIASGMFVWPNTPPGSFGRRNEFLWGMAFGIPSVILQTTGLIMLAVALANEVHDIGIAPIVVDGVTISLLPGSQGADLGASLVAQF